MPERFHCSDSEFKVSLAFFPIFYPRVAFLVGFALRNGENNNRLLPDAVVSKNNFKMALEIRSARKRTFFSIP